MISNRKQLVLLSWLSIVASLPLLAADTAIATLVVSGIVVPSTSVAVSRTINASMVLESPIKKLQIATLTAFSNDRRGFSLSVSSQWLLCGVTDNIPYSLTINNKALDRDGTFFTSVGKLDRSGASMAVLMNTDQAGNRQVSVETYSDTIIFTVTAP